MTITGSARVAGIMGWPVSHSRSPILHGYWLEQYGIDGAYVPLAIAPEDFNRALCALPALGFRGVNVTVPHKEAALAAVEEADETARRIGAVNTIVIGESGQLEGRNTDAFGFRESLREEAPEFDATSGPAVILGAGGAARALVAALLDAGAPAIRIVNRTAARAEALAEDLGGPCEVFGADKTEQALADAALVVNSTSLGMAGQPPLGLDLASLPMTALVVDGPGRANSASPNPPCSPSVWVPTSSTSVARR